jgi:hypothetical protein
VVRVGARRQHLDKREALLKRKWAAINELDTMSQKMLVDTKEVYASAEAWADTTIK